jgi:hypothetical protein
MRFPAAGRNPEKNMVKDSVRFFYGIKKECKCIWLPIIFIGTAVNFLVSLVGVENSINEGLYIL